MKHFIFLNIYTCILIHCGRSNSHIKRIKCRFSIEIPTIKIANLARDFRKTSKFRSREIAHRETQTSANT